MHGAVTAIGAYSSLVWVTLYLPNMMHLTPHNLGNEASRSVMGSQITFAYIVVVLALSMVIALNCFVNRLKKQNKYNANV